MIPLRLAALLPLLLSGCAAPTVTGVGTAPANAALPPGVSIGPSGFATLLDAPPVPYGEVPPPPVAEQAHVRMAREQGIPLTEAERMMNPDDAATEAAIALDQRLKVRAAGNYVGMRIIRDPRPRFAFQFRRDAAATLARYTRDPRFVSREGGVPEAELQPIFDTWWPRFLPHRLVGGGSVNSFDGLVQFDMNIDKAGFDAIAAREGWALPSGCSSTSRRRPTRVRSIRRWCRWCAFLHARIAGPRPSIPPRSLAG